MIRSLQGKLGTGLLLSLITAFIVLWVFISISVRYLTEDYMYSRLSHDTETLLAAIVKNSVKLEIETSKLGAVYQQPFSGHYFEIIRGDKIIRSRSLWDQSLNYPSKQSTQEVRLYQTGPQQQALLMLMSHFIKQKQAITIIVAEDFTPVEEAIGVFQLRFTISTVAILIILVGLQAWVMRRGLKPLKQLQDDLKSLEYGTIRSLNTPVPSELTPLINEINHLHSVLESRLTRHRNALSDLAHALKKPLTVIQQLSKDPSLKELPEITQVLQRQAETTRQLTQRILNRARLAGAAQSGRAFNFDDDLSELLDTLRMMYRDKTLVISTKNISGLHCQFDREDMLELLGNLLDNACKWANHAIQIEVSKTSAFTITIEDDGPGIPKEILQTITKRGVRLDEKVDGHGLGLAIVTDIIQHYNGTMTSGISKKLGGFRVEIKLPL